MKGCFYMPNNHNLLIFRGDNAQIINNYFTDGRFDFWKIIPRPHSLDIGYNVLLEAGMALLLYEDGISTAFDELRGLWKDETDDEIYNELNTGAQYRKAGEIALRNIAKYGHSNQISWNKANWGTLWNVADCKILLRNDNEVKLLFTSDGDTPLPVLRKLAANHPELYIDFLCYDYCEEFVKSYSFYNNNEQEFQYEGRKANAFLAVLGCSKGKVHKYKRLTPHEKLFLYAE